MGLLRNRRFWTVVVVAGIPAAALAWWLGSPLFIDKTVEEEFPLAASAEVPDGMTRKDVEDTMATMAKVDSEKKEPMSEEMTKAKVIKSGEFQGADRAHSGSGTATIYTLADGSSVLRLQSFEVTNGPDLRVILTPHADPEGRSDVQQAGYVELGKLKGNIGNQNYEIPAGADLAPFGAAVIYCKPFHVLFSVAQLQ